MIGVLMLHVAAPEGSGPTVRARKLWNKVMAVLVFDAVQHVRVAVRLYNHKSG